MPERAQETRPDGQFNDELTAYLERYEYHGIAPTVERIESCDPTMLSLSVDLKLPAEGPPKLLELNGTTSGYRGYPKGERVIAERAYELDRAIGVPQMPMESHIEHPRIGPGRPWVLGMDDQCRKVPEGFFVPWAVELQAQQMQRDPGFGESGDFQFADLSEVPVVIWHHGVQDHVRYGDPDQVVVMNPGAVRFLIDRKDAFSDFCEAAGLEHLRPRAWTFYNTDVRRAIEEILADSEGIDTLVIKPTHFGQNSGVTPVSRETFQPLMETLFVNRIPPKHQAAPYMRWFRSERCPFIVEEYVPSKPLKSPNHAEYDFTMRIKVRAVANRESLAVIPMAAYWKRPVHPIDARSPYAMLSDVKRGGSQRVSRTDFARAYEGVAELTKALVEKTRARDRATRLIDC
ncbi:MAG TPA: hypothetical protein VIF43_02515 [Patescibacteria group bacterium]|jgi:hypothetical protein